LKDIGDVGGGGLLRHKYNGSHTQLLIAVYPEYEWLPWKFTQSPKNYWIDIQNKKKFLDWAGKQLGIKEPSDWHKVTPKVEY
jgi:hypothetical protein